MKHGIRLLLVIILLWPAAACHDMYSDVLDSKGLGVFIVAPPVLAGLSVEKDSGSIKLARPALISGWIPASTMTAFIGQIDPPPIGEEIHVSGTTVTGTILEGPVDASVDGYIFANLVMSNTYRIIVVAQNALGSSVQQIVQKPYNPIAQGVYGQGDVFNTGTANKGGLSDTSLQHTYGVAVDTGGVYIADHDNNRVLYYSGTSTIATRVYGQDDFTHNSANKGGSVNETTLSGPSGVAVDVFGVYIADTGNHRVLFYPGTSKTANRVYGQDDFLHNFPNKSGIATLETLCAPMNVTVYANNVYIADTQNSRVLHFSGTSTRADRVYSVGASVNLNLPYAVAIYEGGIYIADTNNNRVLHYSGTSTTSDLVYSSVGVNPSATSLNYPLGVAADESGVYIADYHNHRVLHYWRGWTTATGVYGQKGNLESDTANLDGISATSLYHPHGLGMYAGRLYIADYANYRVLRY